MKNYELLSKNSHDDRSFVFFAAFDINANIHVCISFGFSLGFYFYFKEVNDEYINIG